MGGGRNDSASPPSSTRFESAYLPQYPSRLRPEHTQALAAIKHCRSQASAKMQLACTQCDHQRLVPRPAAIATARTVSTTRASNGSNASSQAGAG